MNAASRYPDFVRCPIDSRHLNIPGFDVRRIAYLGRRESGAATKGGQRQRRPRKCFPLEPPPRADASGRAQPVMSECVPVRRPRSNIRRALPDFRPGASPYFQGRPSRRLAAVGRINAARAHRIARTAYQPKFDDHGHDQSCLMLASHLAANPRSRRDRLSSFGASTDGPHGRRDAPVTV